jgi:hypothetical protein
MPIASEHSGVRRRTHLAHAGQPEDARPSRRLTLGFAAGALAHLIFQGLLGAILYALDLRPALVWSVVPVPPFGVPVTLNNMFWDGLWGSLYGLAAPRLSRMVGRFGGGVLLGLASLALYLAVVLPLKGSGLPALPRLLELVAFDMTFGLGTAFLFVCMSRSRGPRAARSSVTSA